MNKFKIFVVSGLISCVPFLNGMDSSYDASYSDSSSSSAMQEVTSEYSNNDRELSDVSFDEEFPENEEIRNQKREVRRCEKYVKFLRKKVSRKHKEATWSGGSAWDELEHLKMTLRVALEDLEKQLYILNNLRKDARENNNNNNRE